MRFRSLRLNQIKEMFCCLLWIRGFWPRPLQDAPGVTPVSVSSWLASFPVAASASLPPDSCSRLQTQHKAQSERRPWTHRLRGVRVSHRRCWGGWRRRPWLCSGAAPPERLAPPPPLLSQSDGRDYSECQWNSEGQQETHFSGFLSVSLGLEGWQWTPCDWNTKKV